MNRNGLLRVLTLMAVVPALVACENSATAYSLETSQHALVLVREQSYFWDREVKQFVVASRLPHCQRKIRIYPDGTDLTEMEVYEAGDRLWALHQGARWYLASTEKCRVQDWDNKDGKPPGAKVGSFRLEGGVPAFIADQ
jgi:hypothetical protein